MKDINLPVWMSVRCDHPATSLLRILDSYLVAGGGQRVQCVLAAD